jgi:hypothetical protein
MRALAPTSSIRASSSALVASPRHHGVVIAAARWLHVSPRRLLANVNGGKELGVKQDVWFTSAGPAAHPAEGPGSGLDHRPPDERTLKLGKSMTCFLYTINCDANALSSQPSASSKTVSQPSSPTHSLRRYSPRRSPSSSSPQHTHTSPRSQAGSPTQPLSGHHQWHGAASPSWAT